MEEVKELVIDASAQLLMDEISNILNYVKVKRGRRSFETIQNQPIINNLTREDLLHTTKPSDFKFRNRKAPLTMPVGIRFDPYKREYVLSAHDRDNGSELFDTIKKFTLHLGELNNLDISLNTATINKNFVCSKHKDRNNKSKSVLCGFGDYSGGETIIYDNDDKAHIYNINNKPIYFDGKEYYHEVKDFSGTRFSFVSYVI